MVTKKIQLPDTITFKADGWLENAAIVGWVNIMGDDVIIHDDSIEIPTNTLKDYPEKFFNYFAEQYYDRNKPLKMLEKQNLIDEPMEKRKDFIKVMQKTNDTLHDYLSTTSTLNTLKLDNVTIVETKNSSYLEFDDGRAVYDVDFWSSNREYDYEIDPQTGEILSYDYDAEDYAPQKLSTGNSSAITEAKAKEIAVAQVSGATVDDIREWEADYDDGRLEYEGKIYDADTEYEFTIDGYSGSIISWETEPLRR